MSKFEQYLIESKVDVKVRDDFNNNYTMPKSLENKFNEDSDKLMKFQDNKLLFKGKKDSFLKKWKKYKTSKD